MTAGGARVFEEVEGLGFASAAAYVCVRAGAGVTGLIDSVSIESDKVAKHTGYVFCSCKRVSETLDGARFVAGMDEMMLGNSSMAGWQLESQFIRAVDTDG